MSGNVVPATGDVQFLSNASSNAVCQVFGLATNNVSLSSLVGRAYNPSVTAAPVFTAPTVRALPLSLQRDLSGASLFMDTPSNPTIGGLDTNNQGIYPFYSGPTGPALRYYIALGTSSGTINTLSWRDVSINSWNYLPANTFTRDAKYYLSAVLSNISNGRKSLAISNTSDYGQPKIPIMTFTITTPSNWSITWTESSTVTIPTAYYWSVYSYSITNNYTLINSSSVLSSVRSVNGTTELAYDTDYIAIVNGVYSSSTGDAQSSAIRVPALAAPVLTNFTGLPNRSTQNLTVNWGAVTGALEYDVYIGNTEVSRGNTGTSATISISSYTGSVKSVTVYARNRIKTSPASTSLEFFFTTTPVSTTPSITFSRSTTHSIVAVGAGGVSGGVSSGWTAGAGGPGGIVSLQSYASRSTLYYNVGGSGDGGASYFSHGKGGGATAVYTETPDTIVIAGGGGGGGTIYNLGLGTDDFDWHTAICTPGGGGGNGAFANGWNGGDSNVSQTGNQNGYSYYFSSSVNGGRGGDQSSGGAAAPNGTYSNPSSISFFGVYDYNVNGSYSFSPTAGINSSGGRGGSLYWFMYCIGGGGGNGFKAGGGGGASTGIGGQHNGYEEFVGWPGGYVGEPARRVIAGAGGGGGGSSWVNGGHGNPDGTGTHGSSAGVSGMVFIAQRV